MVNYYILAGIFVILLCLIVFVRKHAMKRTIPLCIWTYWDGDKPDLVRRCIDSWRKYNPDYTIIELDKNLVSVYLPEVNLGSLKFASESPARFSDFLRLHILSKYGGIWMDASVICNKPLHWIQDIQAYTGVEFIGYKNGVHTLPEYVGKCDVIESSVFACTKGCEVVSRWRDEFMNINNYESGGAYMQSVAGAGYDLQNAPPDGYWAVFVSLMKVLYDNPALYAKMHLLEACETIYAYQYDHYEMTNEYQVQKLYERNYVNQPLIKLTNWDRAIIEHMYEDLSPLFT